MVRYRSANQTSDDASFFARRPARLCDDAVSERRGPAELPESRERLGPSRNNDSAGRSGINVRG